MTVLHVMVDGDVLGAFGLEDEIRPESVEAIERLHAMGSEGGDDHRRQPGGG